MQDTDSQRRTAVRFSTHDLHVALGCSSVSIHDTAHTFKVNDASPEGCSVLITQEELRRLIPTYTTGVYFTFCNSTNTLRAINSLEAHFVHSGSLHCGFRWASYLRPERLGPFTSFFVHPCNDYQSARQRHKLQELIALKDLDTLANIIANLKTCQFQLILAALPLFVGLLGSAFFIISQPAGQKAPWWALGLPFVCIVLSFAMLFVFMQKAASLRRSSAFKMLLQRYLCLGSFPPCYRGWHDACDTYNHIMKHGVKPECELKYKVPAVRETNFRKKLAFPGDSFNWFGYIFLGAIPALSTVLMIVILAQMGWGMVSYTVVVILSTLGTVAIYFMVVRQVLKLYQGEKNSHHMLILFSKILKHAPIFDAYNNNPL